MKLSKQKRKQRALHIRALLAINSHLFSFKEACERADIPYKSTSNAINRLVKFNDTGAISDERLEALENGVIELSEEKVGPTTA